MCVCDVCVQHEKASVLMFEHLLNVNDLHSELSRYGLTDTDVLFIKEQIAGPAYDDSSSNSQGAAAPPWPYQGRPEEKSFLYEVGCIHHQNHIPYFHGN